MTTQDIVEAILYLNQDTEKYFRACHIIDKNRPYKAKEHSEYPQFFRYTNFQLHKNIKFRSQSIDESYLLLQEDLSETKFL